MHLKTKKPVSIKAVLQNARKAEEYAIDITVDS